MHYFSDSDLFDETLTELLRTIALLDNDDADHNDAHLPPDFDGVNQLVLAGMDWIMFVMQRRVKRLIPMLHDGLMTLVERCVFHTYSIAVERAQLIPMLRLPAQGYEILVHLHKRFGMSEMLQIQTRHSTVASCISIAPILTVRLFLSFFESLIEHFTELEAEILLLLSST